MEDLAHGQRVREYVVEGLMPGNQWEKLCDGVSIGHKRIQQIKPLEVAAVRFRATRTAGEPQLPSVCTLLACKSAVAVTALLNQAPLNRSSATDTARRRRSRNQKGKPMEPQRLGAAEPQPKREPIKPQRREERREELTAKKSCSKCAILTICTAMSAEKTIRISALFASLRLN